ncbi:MAG: MMPL family transporter [Sulfuriflexus sp.]|nr:MMPL family transporter [Sulfuriflexus sp.]
MQAIKDKYINWMLANRWLVIFLVLISVVSSAVGVTKLYFTSDYRIFFSEENPQLQAFEALQDTYTKNDNILFVVAPKDGVVFKRKTLAAIADITKQGWQIPYSIRVDSVTNFQHTKANEDDLLVEDLILNAESLTDEALQYSKGIALSEPLLLNRLISPDASVTGVNVTMQFPGKAQHLEVPEASKFAFELADKMRAKYPELEIRMTGMTVMNNAFSEQSKKDISTLVPLMFLAIMVMLAVLLRSKTATAVTLLIIFSTIISAVGLIGWLGIKLSPPTTTAPIMIMTIVVANCVHILMTFLQEMREGREKIAAMHESLRVNFQPVFLTSLTTALGFLSMNFSDAPPFRDLGNIVALGVGIAFVFSVTLLPAVVTLLPVKVAKNANASKLMNIVAEFVIRYRRKLIPSMAAIIIVLIAFVPSNELNDEFVKYFDESVVFRQDTDFATSHLTGIYLIEYSIPANGSGGISEPEYLQALEKFAAWYRQQDAVLHVNVLTDTMKRLNKNMHGDDESWYKLPDQRDLAAQYLLLYEFSLPFGLDLNNQINVDKSATRMVVTLESISSNQLLGMGERAQDWMKQNLPTSMRVQGASSSMMFAHIGERNIRSMLLGTTIALILISLTLIIALRSFKIGMLSMLPNLVPAAMGFGIWGIFVGQVGLALSIVTSMTLGIIVDDTVHFLSKYIRARREKGMNSEDAVRYAFANVGMALVVTSTALIAGFLVLSLSTFELNAGMGQLTAITIAVALFADFLLLPPLLMKLEGARNEAK